MIVSSQQWTMNHISLNTPGISLKLVIFGTMKFRESRLVQKKESVKQSVKIC
jgi:hypothetical protein